MTPFALALVLIAAVLHATWNLCAKRAGGGLPFIWVVGAVICACYVPVLIFYFIRYEPTLPLAAIAFLGERPSLLALAGSVVIITAIFFLTGGPRLFHEDRAHRRNAITYGVLSGVFIAAYTIWDRHGVAKIGVPPLLYDAGTAFTQLALLTPFALRRRSEVSAEWRDKKHWAIAVALLSPIAYVLVLTALAVAPVSYVAPAREVSIVIGAFLGAKLLKEADGQRRLWAAAAMAVGVIALAFG